MGNQKPTLGLLLLLSTVLLCEFSLAAEEKPPLPLVPPLFSDHMVLQRDRPVPVWGWSAPGSTVTVTINGQTQTTTVTEAGSWRVEIGPFPAGGPHVLEIAGEASITSRSATFSDVLFGDVWLCSGQSNMEWPVHRSTNAEKEMAAANYPRLRHYKVPRGIANEPQPSLGGEWWVCTPKTVGDFTAAGYFFGRDLQKNLGVPIGLIHSSWGGTPAEAWTDLESLGTMEDFQQPVADRLLPREKIERERQGKIREWWLENESPVLQDKWRQEGFDDSAWESMAVPQLWEEAVPRMEEFDGIVRFRRTFELPDAFFEGKEQGEIVLSLGKINDLDTTWVNGRRVGGESQWDKPRRYPVPADCLKRGKNVVTVCACDLGGSGGLYGEEANFGLTSGEQTVSLVGDWKYEIGTIADDLAPFPPGNRSQNTVAALYNAMIAPLGSYGIRGAIWYQGESNAGRPEQYARLLPAMIAGWRKQFGQDFPFFVVQLANFRAVQQRPVEGGWARIRESQQKTADDDDSVGLVVITDIGLADDVHPRNKQDVGKRLSLSARAIAYGQTVVHSGPTYREHTVEGNTIRLKFDNVGSGLVAHGAEIKGFAIAGAEGDFVWATARFDQGDIVVSADTISEPRRVRYNWANNPIGNLFNAEELPAGLFRTDREE